MSCPAAVGAPLRQVLKFRHSVDPARSSKLLPAQSPKSISPKASEISTGTRSVSARSVAVSLARGRGLLYNARTGTLCRQDARRAISARPDALRPTPGRDPERILLISSYVP